MPVFLFGKIFCQIFFQKITPDSQSAVNQAYYFLGGRRFSAYAGEMLDKFEREKPGFEGDYAGCAGLLANVIGDVL